ncbi:hypothetical protein GCM10007103_11540 [Salinimicrobium marinum]|uniref:DUF1853 domain-containing protein n=1 Tax=Salinimicrobium marinum TaxID=680283 RepID=A0A918SAU6_9FLAO|nr:DUF1853 family protein [Salinimicrobium marinum]GHA31584.1 hypothetical protein GCM10007103_11540 [Salinimicrobium marinum]
MDKKSAENDTFLKQFSGFLKTPPLWLNTETFQFPQLLLKEKELSETFPEPNIFSNLVLGKRIERFFRIYLQYFSEEEEVLAENVQIFADKITLGELDFILKNKNSGKVSHIEVVYKFYIYDPSFENELERWIGPNRRDSLIKKIIRLETRQFPLLFQKEAQPLLRELQIEPENIDQKVLFKANLFVPCEILDQHFPGINNECVQGFWIKASEFNEAAFGKYRFFSPTKPDWPVLPENNTTWHSFSEIRVQVDGFLKKERSPLLWMKKNDRIYTRFFIVWW